MNIEAIKDGKGNIVITEDSFEMLLACLDNQKFVHEAPQNGDSLAVGEEKYKSTQQDIQETIDSYNRACRNILHQKYIFSTSEDGYYLKKKYEHQNGLISWSAEDVAIVHELFKNTEIKWKKPEGLLPLDGSEEIKEGTKPIGKTQDGWIVCEPTGKTPWLIERPLRYDNDYLTISEDGKNNRPWTQKEIETIASLF